MVCRVKSEKSSFNFSGMERFWALVALPEKDIGPTAEQRKLSLIKESDKYLALVLGQK
jgi:hypothetical protein